MYGSTEGTVAMINNEDHVGAVGFISRLFPILPINVIKLDENGKKGGKFALGGEKFDKKLRKFSHFEFFCKFWHNLIFWPFFL